MAKIIKFIQINIFKGKYLDALVDFLKQEQPDFVAMQEVSSGPVNLYKGKDDLFATIKSETGLEGVFDPVQMFVDAPKAAFGNAVFSRFPIKESSVVILSRFRSVTLEEFANPEFWPQLSRHVLDVTVDLGGTKLDVMSWHGAWTPFPQDTKETLKQAQLLADYLGSYKEPFVLGCDANAVPESKTIGLVNEAAVNLMTNSVVKQTTHPTAHKIAPRGYLIDYIFASPDLELKSLTVPEVLVSDHLPVIAELELASD